MTGFHKSEIISVLQAGRIIAIPTDTVYGLACDMSNDAAVQKIYELKGRPAEKALPIFIESPEALDDFGAEIRLAARELAQKYWPGPLTLVVRKSSKVPDFVTAGADTVAVRIPNHPAILALLKAFRSPLAVTSANRSGEPEVTSAAEVRALFGDQVILTDGECGRGGVSTIVDTTTEPMKILRQGILKLPEMA